MEALTPWHLVLILIAFVLLAGYQKLPDAARSVGRSLRIFRGEMRALDGEDPSSGADNPTSTPSQTGTAAAAAAPPQAPAVSVAELERQAAEAEELAARLRARADGLPEGRASAS